MRKRLYSVICLCGLISIMIYVYWKQQYQGNSAVLPDRAILQAIVMEAADSSILAKPVEGSPELASADQFSILNEENLELQTGDLIEIDYNGQIMESYPAQLGKVYHIEIIKAAGGSKEEQSSQQETWDLIPMVMINGRLYMDTGRESTMEGRCGMMDGEITSEVDGSKKPTEDNQSNFGTGYGYQYGAIEGTVEIYMNGKWWIFATKEARH